MLNCDVIYFKGRPQHFLDIYYSYCFAYFKWLEE